jgi:hypothetical protein
LEDDDDWSPHFDSFKHFIFTAFKKEPWSTNFKHLTFE